MNNFIYSKGTIVGVKGILYQAYSNCESGCGYCIFLHVPEFNCFYEEDPNYMHCRDRRGDPEYPINFKKIDCIIE